MADGLFALSSCVPRCATCHLSSYQCPGHFGHIELPVPVFHPLFMNQAFGLLRSVCMFCHQFKMPELVVSKDTRIPERIISGH
jgi:DNA-directed RNA polymerase beta' subunit